ncbi:MAG TPA: hypothetical protein VFS64_10345 [Solirubrobacterales bacterium]|nr:hypothetical protein [Solirubrobacterales bacterium]
MKPLRTGLSVLVAGMTLMPPVAAAAQAVVPPDNPAAIQYTQAYPTSHGPADAHRKHKRSPEQALGGHNAERLEAQGKAGQEAARVAAETAPETAGGQATGKGSGPGSTGHPKNQGRNAGGHRASQQAAAGADSGGGSGLGNVAGQATGLGSSDATGLLLPLVLLGAVAWAVAYVLRRRRRAEQ